MIDVVAVCTHLRRFSGLELDTLDEAMPIAAVACAEYSERLKVPEYADEPAVIDALACVCLYRLRLRASETLNGETSYKAGDVSASLDPTAALESAKRLQDNALTTAARFFRDDDFVFEQVGA